jgi:penicillin-binding protein 2
VDFAGKTGSAQTISNATKARLGAQGSKFKDNGWFVGFAPRRNPEVIVAVLMVGGEHGYYAARAAAQVVRTYMEKKHNPQQTSKLAVAAPGMEGFAAPFSDSGREQLAEATRAATRASAARSPEVRAGKSEIGDEAEMAAMWTKRDAEGHEMLTAGRFNLAQWAP